MKFQLVPCALIFGALLIGATTAVQAAESADSGGPAVGSKFSVPASPRAVYNFNPGWRFAFGEAAGADQPGFDDSAWAAVSLPHTWNETDSYRTYINHGLGDVGEKMLGIGWYRKHFQLPANADGQKVFLEFDGMRQAGHFFLNGQFVGKYENGITAVGLDITRFVKFGGQDNLLAVKVDNSPGYREEGTNTPFQWNGSNMNPNFGGLNRDAKLIVTGLVYQTLPLYENLYTTGVYVYPQRIDVKGKTADIKVEAEVTNESGESAPISLSAVVVDADGIVRAQLAGKTANLYGNRPDILTASGSLAGVRLWDVDDPYLYSVYSILSVNGQVVDVCRTQTGFRKAEFKGGAGTGGVWLNDRFIWLTGYSQRSANDWPGLGGAYPDWMHDFNAALIRASNGNYIRWMHISPERADVAACDKYGIVNVCPAGDSEGDSHGRQWDQRAEVMRDSIISYRNDPSIFFWETGNTIVTPGQMVQMVALRKQWDPNGGRVTGSRDNDDVEANKALTPVGEYFGVMIGQAAQTDKVAGDDIFRGYSIARRDKAPLIETEDFRDEAARGIWDDYSPPHFGFKPHLGPGPGAKGPPGPKGPPGGRRGQKAPPGPPGLRFDTYHWNSETFCLAAAVRYASYVRNRIDNPDPAHSKWSAYASIYWSDSDADGRQGSSEVLRVSGKVDGVRLPKELFFVSRVMQSAKPDLHIIGHWTYPANTAKTVYVAATLCDRVELYLNGRSLGAANKPTDFADAFDTAGRRPGAAASGLVFYDPQPTDFIYAFPNVAFVPGTLKAVATKDGQVVAQEELKTAGPPAALRLTVHAGPHGLQADGSDVVLVDFEAVDAQGNRCPTDEARVDFAVDGPAVWRGGFNSALLNSTNNLYLNTECGINRVAIRSTLTPGTIMLTATRAGLTPASVQIVSQVTEIKGGLETDPPQAYSGLAQAVPGLVP
jgi:beta-galactosidase